MSLTSRLVEAQRRALPPGPSTTGLPARPPKDGLSRSTLDPSVLAAAERLLNRERPLYQVERAARLAMRGRATEAALRGAALNDTVVTPLPFRPSSVVQRDEHVTHDVASRTPASVSEPCPACGEPTTIIRIDLVDDTATRQCSGCGLIRLTSLAGSDAGPHGTATSTVAGWVPGERVDFDDVSALDA